MTLDQMQSRDRRIAELEAKGRDRTRTEDREYGGLVAARDMLWRRIPQQLEIARRRAAELESYAAQHRLPLGGAA